MRLILVAAIGIVVLCGGFGVWYWSSQPQALKRACRDATWKTLVAPSTAKLLNFEISSQATVVRSKFQRQASDLEKKIADNEVAQAQIKKAGDRFSAIDDSAQANKSLDPSQRFSVLMSSLSARSELAEKTLKLIDEENDLKKKLADIQSAMRGLDALKVGEIVLTFDSQNRASALLRMQAVCTYHQENGASATARTVQFFEVGESGSL